MAALASHAGDLADAQFDTAKLSVVISSARYQLSEESAIILY